MWSVTLKQLRQAGACLEGYNKVVCMLSGREFDESRESYMRFKYDGQISLIDIVNNNGIDDALWAARCIVGHDRDLRLYAVWCARKVQHLMDDERSRTAIDVAERYANKEASEEELSAARDAAWDAAKAAARAAAMAAARDAALDAVRDAALDAVRDAAWDAAKAAARAVASDAAWVAASDAAWVTARDSQKDMFINMCRGEAPWQVKE